MGMSHATQNAEKRGKKRLAGAKQGKGRKKSEERAKARKRQRKSKKAKRTLRRRRRAARIGIGLKGTKKMLTSVFKDVHAKRVESIANYSVGVMQARSAAVQAIGAAYAETAKIKPKHGIKQVDRFLSNKGIDVEASTPAWVRFVLGPRKKALLIQDWTEFDSDDHTTLCVYLATTHGRATPLAWKTFQKSTLTKGARTNAEHAMIDHLARAIPPEIEITLLADRGFGSSAFYQTLSLLGWDYVIRFKGTVIVHSNDESKPAKEWLPASGRAKKLLNAKVTRKEHQVGAVVVVQRKGMKEPWYLATSFSAKSATALIKLYGRRFTIEETFRDQKDLHFGMGLSSTHIRDPRRRDRLLMLLAIAQAILTLLGAASERAGLDAYLKANTVKKRTHSLFRQGSYWYRCLPTMRDDWFERLIHAFDEVLVEHAHLSQICGQI